MTTHTNQTNTLADLAAYADMAEKRARTRSEFWTAFSGAAHENHGQHGRRKIGDLLGTVMALSARTRRMVRPKAMTEIDVFTPLGQRAVRMYTAE